LELPFGYFEWAKLKISLDLPDGTTLGCLDSEVYENHLHNWVLYRGGYQGNYSGSEALVCWAFDDCLHVVTPHTWSKLTRNPTTDRNYLAKTTSFGGYPGPGAQLRAICLRGNESTTFG
jgi:hypothetical protein